jgi:hypothetical protein
LRRAVWAVDQAAALVVCSLAVAEQVGLASDAVHIWSGAEAVEVLLPGARRWLGRSEGLEAAVRTALDAARIGSSARRSAALGRPLPAAGGLGVSDPAPCDRRCRPSRAAGRLRGGR